MADPLIDASPEPIKALHAELLRHARDIDALFRRTHRDHHEMKAILVALSAIADALSEFEPSAAAFACMPASRVDEKSEDQPSSIIDQELSDAVDRISDFEIREIFLRRLAELGYRMRPPHLVTA